MCTVRNASLPSMATVAGLVLAMACVTAPEVYTGMTNAIKAHVPAL